MSEYYELVIVADTNDGDYITQISKIDQDTLTNCITPVVEAIAAFKKQVTCNDGTHYSWPNSHYRTKTVPDIYPNLDTRLLEWFEEYVPSHEDGVHSIETISIKSWVPPTLLVHSTYT